MSKRRWTNADIEKAIEMHRGGLSWEEVAKAFGVKPPTLDGAIARWRNAQEPPNFYLGHLNGPPIRTCREVESHRRNAIIGSANLRAQIQRVFG